MPKQIRLNAFDMNCVGHQSPGLWTHPRDQADKYNTLDYWVQLARLLEWGKFDALFLADVLGIYDVYQKLTRHGAGKCSAGPGERSADGHPGDGLRHPPSRLRRDLRADLRASLSFRPADVDVGPPDQRACRLEHCHRVPRERCARHGHDEAGGPRHALRDRRGQYAGRLQALGGELGGWSRAAGPARAEVCRRRPDPSRSLFSARRHPSL